MPALLDNANVVGGVAMTPLWVALISAVRRDKPLPRIGVIGLALGFAGVAMLLWPSGDAEIDTAAAFLVVVAALSWASGSYYSQRAPMPRRPLVMTGDGDAVGFARVRRPQSGTR